MRWARVVPVVVVALLAACSSSAKPVARSAVTAPTPTATPVRVVHAVLDDHGLRFTPSTFAAGNVRVTFDDRRVARAATDTVELRFVVSGPQLVGLVVPAGQSRERMICPGAWDVYARINGSRDVYAQSFDPQASRECSTPVT